MNLKPNSLRHAWFETKQLTPSIVNVDSCADRILFSDVHSGSAVKKVTLHAASLLVFVLFSFYHP
jgi:hypothetical protein